MTPERRAAVVSNLLAGLDEADAVACNCVLLHALNPEDEAPFEHTDPHVVVGAFVRRLIRGEDFTATEHKRALEALADLPPIGATFEEAIAHGLARKNDLPRRRRAHLRVVPKEPR
ncbi:MAG: hypothetical protein HOW73_47915 [Polyangiaceae bacterium]|nr:hypothetical protein [Polyangiaceae bacterium]